MSPYLGQLIDMGEAVSDLVTVQSKWSQETFGTDAERGPIGPLKHLEKEAREAQANPTDHMEYADCLILVLDAARRAGIKPLELFKLALKKMEINMKREWPKSAGNDEAVEHIR